MSLEDLPTAQVVGKEGVCTQNLSSKNCPTWSLGGRLEIY